MSKHNMSDTLTWLKSAPGLSIVISVVVAVAATIDAGPYLMVNMVVTGGMLALVATGLTLMLGVLNIPMFAHGEYFMIGSLTAYYIFTPISEFILEHPDSWLVTFGPFIAILGALIGGAIAGAISEKLVFGPLRRRSTDNWVMNSFLLTVGLSVLLVNLHQLIFGADFKGIVGYWQGMPISIAGAYISLDRALAFIISAVIVALFYLFMTYTRTGMAIRAVSQDITGAEIVGIDIEKIVLLTISLACALAAVAGGSLLFMYPSYPTVGLEPLYMAWFVVILSGLGNILGAVAGAFMVALLKVITMEYVGAGWDFVVPSALIMLILIFKPSGIFGSDVRGVLDK
ncbi:branched-chain amino acid ABC transporter permease [Desulfotignum phosphitoxidans]|uniref:High-affinity branched-chain amino acid transport system permease protein LivH n=1 Tax=Desulfotignum phosphitoxidans DSM 13687 TaxID=1286635 RepID=S0G446_9BACT|nr:branched-chain amino acid ABC transporter permease [Desulfotignum phosphitoxidans]EMS81690.1 high-affinity branched-chain amino acid transport system permease protein LivH [Desulfotignum phosphitoxidans DSM 13687]